LKRTLDTKVTYGIHQHAAAAAAADVGTVMIG